MSMVKLKKLSIATHINAATHIHRHTHTINTHTSRWLLRSLLCPTCRRWNRRGSHGGKELTRSNCGRKIYGAFTVPFHCRYIVDPQGDHVGIRWMAPDIPHACPTRGSVGCPRCSGRDLHPHHPYLGCSTSACWWPESKTVWSHSLLTLLQAWAFSLALRQIVHSLN